MAKRHEINQVRTDYLEAQIAHYKAMGNTEATLALERLARHIGAIPDVEAIEHEVLRRREIYRGGNTDGVDRGKR